MGKTRILNVVREMMAKSHTSQRGLSEKIGKCDSYAGVVLSSETAISAASFVEMATQMGFRVYVEGHGTRFDVGEPARAGGVCDG
ncbi:hypothetical protein [Xiamenia xianingshaonis]|uniref:Uncharacterized protein n=1 Tax=Xiamenia xianingshaonis TaxID=2682776 RepID=A0A9E6MS05_9ACTN|nr:hypothetical protein [Xiamenia xianingshaonis]NHM14453.1 hypothetical protein [Xiamenia xianingshaonis]QTU84927.1 hypothetical protein J7S26_03180 [Xiamenia xianingshaonis]